jgi:hypothetical protein
MPSTYSALKIQLMATGENNGTWGDITNQNFLAFQQLIAGQGDVVFASADVTLTLVDSNALQTARAMYLNCGGTTGGAPRTLTLPSVTKQYIITNFCADNILVKTATSAATLAPPGRTINVFVNSASNIVETTTYSSNFSAGAITLPANCVGTTQLQNSAVTGPKIANGSIDGNKWTVGSSYAPVNTGINFYKSALVGTDLRWSQTLSGVESGGNVGGDLYISAYSDTGVSLGSPVSFQRNNLQASFYGPVLVTGPFILRSCAAANGFWDYYYIYGVVRWGWRVEPGASPLPGALNLYVFNASGTAVATPLTFNLANYSATFGTNTEVIFTRDQQGIWGNGTAVRLNGYGPALTFKDRTGTATAVFGQYNAESTFAMMKGDGTPATFYFNIATGVGTTTTWTSTSDSRLKFDVTPLPSGLDTLAALSPFTYMQAVSEADAAANIGTFSAGIIAQDLVGTPLEGLVIPPAPDPYGGETFYAFNYTGLTAWYVAAFKEVKTRLDDIEARLAAAGL